MNSIISRSGDQLLFKETSAGLVVNNSTALVDIPNLVFNVAANSWYRVEIFVGYQAAIAAGLRFQMTNSAGGWGGVMCDFNGNARVPGTPMNVAGGGVGTELPWWLLGYLNVGGTAGTFKLQAAQWVADASNMTISVGSWLSIRKIA